MIIQKYIFNKIGRADRHSIGYVLFRWLFIAFIVKLYFGNPDLYIKVITLSHLRPSLMASPGTVVMRDEMMTRITHSIS
jgi:hypothetical protein